MRFRLLVALVLASGVLASGFATRPALAQFGPDLGAGVGGPGGMSPQSRPEKKSAAPKPPPGTPEMHAATSADSLIAPGSEPTLPEDPLRISDAARKRIGSDAFKDNLELGRSFDTDRDFYGLYYGEKSGNYSFKTLFPLWVERQQPSVGKPTETDRASLFGGIYYNRRSATHNDDILFPLFWNLTEPNKRTTIVGPFVNRVAEYKTKQDGVSSSHTETDNWLAPLYFTGTRKHGGYTILPPLLSYFNHDDKGGFNLIGPGFCSWKGGSSCSASGADDIDLGVAPFFFYGHDEVSKYRIIPPLLHYHTENERALTSTNIWGPLYQHHSEERDALHLLPLYYSLSGKNERHTTLLPFFHYGYKDNTSLFVNPLFLSAAGENGESTFITWGFARYRGRTELDMWTPLYWQYRDPDIGLDKKLLFPFFYRATSPRQNDFMLFPLYGHFERYGLSETTWVTPVFRYSQDLRGWSTSINPLLHVGRSGNDSHLVVAPFFWDFSSPSARSTIAFPLYWRFAERDTLSQLVGNVYYREKRVKQGRDWEVHVFPFFTYGETPDGHWWNVLYGLAGYTRQGSTAKVRTLWVPIKVSE